MREGVCARSFLRMLPSFARLALREPTDALCGGKRDAAAGPSETPGSPPRVVRGESLPGPSDADAYVPQRLVSMRFDMLPWFDELKGATFAYTITLPEAWELKATEAFRRGSTGFVFKGTYQGQAAAIVVRALGTPVPRCEFNNPFEDEPFDPRRCVKMTASEFSRSISKLRQFDTACFAAGPSAVQVTPRLFAIGQFGGCVELEGPNVTDAKRASLAAVQFGVEVWELWDMSMESYLRFHAVPLASVESQNLKRRIVDKYNEFAARTKHWISDLHLGNVFVQLSTTDFDFNEECEATFPLVERLVLGDFGGARDQKPSSLPTDDLADAFEGQTSLFASGDELKASRCDQLNAASTLADDALSRRRLV